MKPLCTIRFFSFFLLALLLVQHPAIAQEDLAQNPVNIAFQTYKTAILNDDAETAFESVDSNTIQYYADMLDYALHLSEEQTRQLRLIDLLTVLAVRHRVPDDVARSMNPETFFKYGVSNGWVGKNSVMGLEVVRVDIDGDFAITRVAANGVESPAAFHFHREGGTWKLDLTSIMAVSNLALTQVAEQQGLTEAELLFSLLESVSGKKVDESIWQPINQR